MVYGKEKLLEAFDRSGWEMGDVEEELLFYNTERNKRFSYEQWESGRDGIYANLGLFFLDKGSGEWVRAFSMGHLTTGKNEEFSFLISARAGGSEYRSKEVFYDSDLGSWLIRGEQSTEIGSELLYDVNRLPKKLDLEMTADLFIRQTILGKMERPVLVPKGLFTYEKPVLVDSLGAYSPSLMRAQELIAKAKTDEEIKTAEAIFWWVVDLEGIPAPK